MKRESAGAVIYNIFFILIAIALLAAGTVGITAGNTVFSLDFYQETIKTDDISLEIKGDLKQELKNEISNQLQKPEYDDEISDIVDTAIDSDLFGVCLNELVDFVFLNDEINNQLIKDEFMNTAGDVMNEAGLSTANQNEIADIVTDGIDSALDELVSSFQGDIDNTRNILNTWQKTTSTLTIVAFVVVAVLFLISILIHKNKGYSLRALGISGLVGNASIIIVALIAKPYIDISFSVNQNDPLENMINDVMRIVADTVITNAFIFAVLSLLMLIGGICMAISYKNSHADDDFDGYAYVYNQQNLFNPPSYE